MQKKEILVHSYHLVISFFCSSVSESVNSGLTSHQHIAHRETGPQFKVSSEMLELYVVVHKLVNKLLQYYNTKGDKISSTKP